MDAEGPDDPGATTVVEGPDGPGSRVHGYWLVAIALTASAAFALASYVVSRYVLDVDFEFIPALTTALILGAFFSLLLARPRRPRTEFKVERRR